MRQLIISIIFLISFNAIAQNNELKAYTDFLKDQNTSAKDYILNLFDKNDIVILCERDHREITQYDLILEVLKDKRFVENIQNAYFEIGNEKNNDQLNSFLHNKELKLEEVANSVMHLHRNIYGAGLWEKANYSYYIKGVHDINKVLPAKNQINIFGLDIGVDWKTATEEDILEKDSLVSNVRDSIMASNFINLYKKQGKTQKALVVLNYRHAFLKDLFELQNAGRFIADAFPEKVANVYINSFVLKRNEELGSFDIGAINDGKWDASFIKANKSDVGFDFENSPFGNDNFDIIPFENDFKFNQYFTGFIYYTYFPDLRIVSGIKGFIDDDFLPELLRRYELEQCVYKNKVPDIETLKENYNTVIDKTYREEKEDFGKAIKQIEKWLK